MLQKFVDICRRRSMGRKKVNRLCCLNNYVDIYRSRLMDIENE